MITITNEEAASNILAAVEAGTLVQGKWHGNGDDGRAIACLLGAIDPKVNKPADCNGELMPMWLAELTPALFDGISFSEINMIARRYGQLVARWHILQEPNWQVILRNFLVRTIDDAVDAARPGNEGKAYWQQVVEACEQSKQAIASGDDKSKKKAAARAAANAAANAAAAYLKLFTFLLDQIEDQCKIMESQN